MTSSAGRSELVYLRNTVHHCYDLQRGQTNLEHFTVFNSKDIIRLTVRENAVSIILKSACDLMGLFDLFM